MLVFKKAGRGPVTWKQLFSINAHYILYEHFTRGGNFKYHYGSLGV